jgi:copper chaperone CopZ
MESIMKKTKKFILVGMGLTLTLILITGMVMAQESVTQTSETQKINRAVIKIDTLTCGACFSAISAGLTPMNGYSGMGTNLFRKLIAVDFNTPLTQEKISLKLIELGYPGKLESVEEITQKQSFAYLESKRTGFTGSGGGCGSSSAGCGGSPLPSQSNNTPGTSQVPARQIPQTGGSCCAVPGNSIPTNNL